MILFAAGCEAAERVAEEPRVVFGDDNRVDVRDAESSALSAGAGRVAALIPWSRVDCADGFENCELTPLEHEVPFCWYEPFANQPEVSSCTAYLVGEDLMVTAGHCIEDQAECDDAAFVFDYRLGDDDDTRLTHHTAYGCEELIYQRYDDEEDIALVRIDRPIPTTPLCIEREDHPAEGTRLAMASFPSGMPKKVVDGGLATAGGEERWFRHTLDTAAGSSGSPVFDRQTMRVLGTHFGGPEDAIAHDDFNRCVYWVGCPEEGCENGAAGATSTTTIADMVPEVPCLSGESPHQNPGSRYDVNDDGETNDEDMVLARDRLAALGSTDLTEADARPPYLDIDGNGRLTQADVTLIAARFGTPNVAPGSCGDFDGDGVAITTADFVKIFSDYEGPAQDHAVDGDCNNDRRLTSTDWVLAFQAGVPYVG